MAFGTSYWFDEIYMLAIGRYHLDWGSADQPPLAPALAALADVIAPGSVIALRLPAVLATAGAVVVAGLIARELECDGRAQVFTASAQATGLWENLVGHWLTPYTLEPLQWMLLVWLLIRWQRVRDDRLLLVLGVVIGIAAMTKFQVMLLCLVLLVAVAIRGPRDLLRRPLFWAGAVFAALIAAPTLIWQHLHGWPQLRMTPVVAGEAEALYGGRPGISVQLLVFAGLAGLVLGSYGLFRLLRADEMRPYRYLGMTFVALYVVFVATAGRPYYLAGLYAPLVAAGALGLQRRREARPCAAPLAGLVGVADRNGRRGRPSGHVGVDRPLRRRGEHCASHRRRLPRPARRAAGPNRHHRRVLHHGRVRRRLLAALRLAAGIQPQPELRVLPPAAARPRRRALRRK
jgi:hypothetical protein